ncbi:hypothetical protein [Kaistia defluvii]|uniref:Uncharacterized protein n=1 Tax=Kaistia defluvii TaxID=410841 RepID=A0ABV2R578_9HYPH
MNDFNDFPLDVENGEPVIATIAHWHEPAPLKGGFSIPACSYGVNLVVGGQFVRQLWGAGYAPEPIPIISHALWRVLNVVPATSLLEVEAMADFGLSWGPNGYVANRLSGRKLAERNLALWSLMQELQAAHQAGRWSFTPLPKKKADRWSLFKAKETDLLVARPATLKHKARHSPTPDTYPRGIAFLQGGTV